MQKSFVKKEAIKFGWGVTTKNIPFFLAVFAIIIAVSLLSNWLNSLFQDVGLILLVTTLLGIFVQTVLEIGLTKISLNAVDGKKLIFEDLYKHYKLFISYFLASLVYGLVVLVGFILLIVPGVIFALKLQFAIYFIVDKKMGVMDSLRKSWQVTKGHTLNLFLFWFLLIGLNILGFFALVVGLLVTVPTTIIAVTWVYRKISA